VSVRRAATGNIHRAVGSEFVLNVNDIVYFSGLIEGFGEFCHEHGLELVTNESLEAGTIAQDPADDAATSPLMSSSEIDDVNAKGSSTPSDEEERLRHINLMTGTNRMIFLSSLSTHTSLILCLIYFRYYPRYCSSEIYEAQRK